MSTKPIECTGSTFRGLKNPYTGDTMKVMMVPRENAEPLFFAPDTYDTRSHQPSARAAYDNWNRVDGVFGLKTGSMILCAYTGEELSACSDGETHWFSGGFNPTVLHTRDEFLRGATMRGGKPTRDLPTPMDLKAEKVDEQAPAPRFHETECTDAAMDAAIELARKSPSKGRRK